jgi:hypothetical protein
MGIPAADRLSSPEPPVYYETALIAILIQIDRLLCTLDTDPWSNVPMGGNVPQRLCAQQPRPLLSARGALPRREGRESVPGHVELRVPARAISAPRNGIILCPGSMPRSQP